MVPVPTSYLNVPIFGSGAANIQPDGSTYAGGFLPGQLFPAEYENWLMNRLTTNSLASQTTNLSVAAEIVNVLSQASITPDPVSTTQLYSALNSLYATVGALSSEATTRATADTTLQSNINAEATARANADALLAPKASPTFTGTPAAPTPSPGDNTTKLATTAFVAQAISVINASLVITSIGSQQFINVSGTNNVSSMNIGELRSLYITASGSTFLRTPTDSGSYFVLVQSNSGSPVTNPVANNTQFVFLTGGGSYSGFIIRLS